MKKLDPFTVANFERLTPENIVQAAEALPEIAAELRRLNHNLENGTLSIRTHHPMCTVPPNADWSIAQLEAASKFLAHSIETGALVLPPREPAS